MITQYNTQLENVIPLLNNYANTVERSEEEKQAKVQLQDYLQQQEMEFVKVIQVVLHIGRTKTKDPLINGEQVFMETWRALDVFKGWRTKEIEIGNMIIKEPLDEILQKGIDIIRR